MSEAWKQDAACRGVDPGLFIAPSAFDRMGNPTFLPNRLKQARRDEALAYCRRCTVTAECLAYAQGGGERSGVWGGHWIDSDGQLHPPSSTPAL